MAIRSMAQGDKPAVMRILHNTPEFSADEAKVAEELIDLYLQQGKGSGYHLLVEESDSAVNGYICFGPTPLTEGVWDIYWIAVDAKKQNKGIGRGLLETAEKEITEAKGRMILIETSSRADYEKTRYFYHVRRYEPVARIPDFYSPGDDKLILRKSVSAEV